jgi:Lrp/AsnC family transcriptional regulator for asnA, asnC and gidA
VDKTNLDKMDTEIIRLLTENGRMPIGEMAKKLKVTSPTIRNRIKDLEKSGVFKVSGLIDPNKHQEMITALVAMSIKSDGKMDQILKKIGQLANVVWVGVVTGRYDIMAEVVCIGGKDELYRFTTETILKMGNVVRSETFIIMKSRHNWIRLPDGVESI